MHRESSRDVCTDSGREVGGRTWREMDRHIEGAMV